MVVLTGVPCLKKDQVENYLALHNKVDHWLSTYKGLSPYQYGKIIMARRLTWVGHRPKDIQGDCVVVNFLILMTGVEGDIYCNQKKVVPGVGETSIVCPWRICILHGTKGPSSSQERAGHIEP